MRELMKQIIQTYSAAKTFPYILEGLRSRNNRTRIESADHVGFLLDNYGAEVLLLSHLVYVSLPSTVFCGFFVLYLPLYLSWQISGQLKSLQIVASLTAERDGDTRKAALNTLAIGYKIIGEFIPYVLDCSSKFIVWY